MPSSRQHRLRQLLTCTIQVAASILLCIPLSSQATQSGPEIIGKWKFIKVLDMAEMAAMDEHEAQRFVGQIITIRRDGARIGSRVCAPAEFETKRVEPALYLAREAGADNSKLHLPNPVTVVDISCTQVYVRKKDRAVIFWKGWFFEIDRLRR